jgi:hypothetical protein
VTLLHHIQNAGNAMIWPSSFLRACSVSTD